MAFFSDIGVIHEIETSRTTHFRDFGDVEFGL